MGLMDNRKELSRLILDGLNGRSRARLYDEVERYFKLHGETMGLETFRRWLTGEAFPSNRRRQLLLADVVGGPCGEAIKRLQGPAFRGYRQRMMKESEEMRKDLSTKNLHIRQFRMVRRMDEGGKPSFQSEIQCVTCSRTYHHLRRGELQSEEYFRRKGWEVGNNDKHDYCPECVENKRKVVKMSDHKKPEAAAVIGTAPAMSKEDGRLIFKAIEAHWDDNLTAYHPGWSDQKIAEENGTLIDWVRQVRDLHYGGVGEDPGIAQFITEQATLKGDLEALTKDLGELESGVASMSRLLAGYKEKQGSLSSKIHRLAEVAGRLRPPFRDAG